ncbi:S1C family serine protease [Clostridium sp.]|uniref:S1C family serine protease n=1 Tax=Clostridium sp. TaxID=1506 RepID=UPI003F307F5A
MSKKNNIKKYKSEDFFNQENSSIRFKRNKTKSNIRFGGKLILYFILAGVSGALFSNIMMKIKYDVVIQQAKENRINEDMVILDYTKIIKKVSPSLVSISDKPDKLTENDYFEGNTTGIIIHEDGTILTNYSKVKELENIYVKLSSKGTMPIKAVVVGGNEETDIAILRISYEGELVPVKLAASDEIKEGQGIAVLSNAIGDEYIGSIVPGMITSTNRKMESTDKLNKYQLIEISSPINELNTGGAVCNAKGELIGIASYSITNKNKQEGLYYAIDLSVLEEVINSTNIFKGILGLSGGGIISSVNTEVNGFYVENVVQDGNAYNAGIRPTDIIFELDGKQIVGTEDLSKIVEEKKSGDVIDCKVMRDGKVEEVEIILKRKN